MKFRRLLNLTRPWHLTEEELRGLKSETVVYLVTYEANFTVRIGGSKGLIIPVIVNSDVRPKYSIYITLEVNSLYIPFNWRRRQVTFLYDDLGKEFAVLPFLSPEND